MRGAATAFLIAACLVYPAAAPATQPAHAALEASAHLDIRSDEDVYRLRRALVLHLWGQPALPASKPVAKRGITDARYQHASLARIDRLTLTMDFGLQSIAYHFTPKAPNGRLVLYHQGHDGDFYLGRGTIFRLLESGHAVVAFAMPLMGLNNQPVLRLPRHGELKLTHHDALKFLSPPRGSPIQYFIEPVIAALNHLAAGYSGIAMIGLSGGGWTTTLAAAVDTRIAQSFPVAGSYPIALRAERRDWGDYEQTEPALYSTVNYLELYVLGSHGPGRSQVQVINEFDPCCFSGTAWRSYRGAVRSLGDFEVFMDSSHREHLISEGALQMILARLR